MHIVQIFLKNPARGPLKFSIMKQRLDKFLSTNPKIKSRERAAKLIKSGAVSYDGKIITKPSFEVEDEEKIKILNFDELKYVSRGGFKLEGAIKSFSLDFNNKCILDIGSSTGGFTDCALKNGAKSVIAVDVGTNLMDIEFRKDTRVFLFENTDFRKFSLEKLNDIDIVVCDASFISLSKIIEPLKNLDHDFLLVLLIKPQFECGKEIAKKLNGVILDKKIHLDILKKVILDLSSFGFFLKEITHSPICGGDGNIEYISLFSKDKNDSLKDFDFNKIIDMAFLTLKNK